MTKQSSDTMKVCRYYGNAVWHVISAAVDGCRHHLLHDAARLISAETTEMYADPRRAVMVRI